MPERSGNIMERYKKMKAFFIGSSIILDMIIGIWFIAYLCDYDEHIKYKRDYDEGSIIKFSTFKAMYPIGPNNWYFEKYKIKYRYERIYFNFFEYWKYLIFYKNFLKEKERKEENVKKEKLIEYFKEDIAIYSKNAEKYVNEELKKINMEKLEIKSNDGKNFFVLKNKGYKE